MNFIKSPREYRARTGSEIKRLTVDSLKFYVPMYQAGTIAEKKILDDNFEIKELNKLETQMILKELSLAKIVELASPLIVRELNKLLVNSLLTDSHEVFDLLYFAGIKGMRQGLEKFDVNKINKSSTNYLFQWVDAIMKKELLKLEAPFGIPPTRYEKYKKISAVRRKLTEELERSPENKEIYDYFQSGKADMRGKKGKVSDSGKPSQANKNISLKMIEEQEDIERRIKIELLDPLGDYTSDIKMSIEDPQPFSETLFGVFLYNESFTIEAESVLKSELEYSPDDSYENIVSTYSMTDREYRRYVRLWNDFFRDPKQSFYLFLKSISEDDFEDINIPQLVEVIEKKGIVYDDSHYSKLRNG